MTRYSRNTYMSELRNAPSFPYLFLSLALSLFPSFLTNMWRQFIAGLQILTLLSTVVLAGDVQYAVVAFPQGTQSVGVSVGGQIHPLARSQEHPNLFTGTAPAGDTYQYVLIGGQNNQAEPTQRKLAQGATSTGNEFFGRSQTVYDVPALPQAYNPIYPRKLLMMMMMIHNRIKSITASFH